MYWKYIGLRIERKTGDRRPKKLKAESSKEVRRPETGEAES